MGQVERSLSYQGGDPVKLYAWIAFGSLVLPGRCAPALSVIGWIDLVEWWIDLPKAFAKSLRVATGYDL